LRNLLFLGVLFARLIGRKSAVTGEVPFGRRRSVARAWAEFLRSVLPGTGAVHFERHCGYFRPAFAAKLNEPGRLFFRLDTPIWLVVRLSAQYNRAARGNK
jgi:hypothetical protein